MPFGIKLLDFFLIRFLITFWITFGEGPAAGADPPEPQEPEELRKPDTPFTPCGVGADLKASPLPPAPLATSRFAIDNLKVFRI